MKTYYDICPACIKVEEDNYAKIREFLRSLGRKSTVDEIVENTGVAKKYVVRMMDSGRLLSDFAIEYSCAMCGTLISAGRLCSKCTGQVNEQVRKMEEESAAGPRGPQVHVKTAVK
ncbi:MAG: hypothetical protein N3A57_02535 [Negativicutes bacterium]|nr:hypothetical protein [Negativicutes bacterium]